MKFILTFFGFGIFFFSVQGFAVECTPNQEALVQLAKELDAQCNAEASNQDACEMLATLPSGLKELVCD